MASTGTGGASKELARDAHPKRPNRTGTVITRVIVVACLLTAANLALCWLLLPAGSMGEALWYRYYQRMDEPIDTIICGTSFAMQGIDPALIDETLGSHSQSLATPGQSRTSTLIALRDAYEDHHITRAIVGVSIESMGKTESRPAFDLAFSINEMRGRPPLHAAGTYLRTLCAHQHLSSADSFAMLMPWSIWNAGFSPAAIRTNLAQRRTMTALEIQATNYSQPITEQGYAPAWGSMSTAKVAKYAVAADESEYQLDGRVLDEYRAICQYCAQHDIKLYFACLPWIDYLLVRYERPGGYALAIKPFVDAMTAEGATFLDCPLLRPSYYRAKPSEFYNEQHINYEGAQRFTPHLADLIARVERGEDISSLFYDHSMEGWQEYLDSIRGILLSTFTATPVDGAIELAMKSWTAPGIEVEYAVFRVREEGGYEQLRDYATDTTFSLPVEGHGVIKLRINARRAGSKRRCERFCVRSVRY